MDEQADHNIHPDFIWRWVYSILMYKRNVAPICKLFLGQFISYCFEISHDNKQRVHSKFVQKSQNLSFKRPYFYPKNEK